MLRFANWKIVAILAMTLSAVLVVAPSLLSPSNYEALAARLPYWARPRDHRARPRPAGRLQRHAGGRQALRVAHAGQESARRRRAAFCARRRWRSTGGIGRRRAACSCASRTPPTAPRSCPSCSRWRRATAKPASAARRRSKSTTPATASSASSSPTPASPTKSRRAVEQSIEVIRRRVDALGTREPNIQRQGDDRILVQVPGLQDPEQLKTILGQTAKLEFRLVAEPGQSPAEIEELEQADQQRQDAPSRSRSWCRARI